MWLNLFFLLNILINLISYNSIILNKRILLIFELRILYSIKFYIILSIWNESYWLNFQIISFRLRIKKIETCFKLLITFFIIILILIWILKIISWDLKWVFLFRISYIKNIFILRILVLSVLWIHFLFSNSAIILFFEI